MKLLLNGLTKFTCGLLLVGLMLFLPAGTLQYAHGWLLLGLLFGPMLMAGFVMFFKSPDCPCLLSGDQYCPAEGRRSPADPGASRLRGV